MAAKTSHLPPEIIETVLSKLRVKPLLRFKSVSKSWNAIISDHVFVQNHYQQSRISNSGNLFLRNDDLILKSSSNRFSVVKLGDRNKSSSNRFSVVKLGDRNKSSSNRFSVVKLGDGKFQSLQVIECTFEWEMYLCFCKGVLLLSTHRKLQEFMLWNPSTRTHTKISHPDRSGVAASGLCHDPITNDFKVVIVGLDHYSVYSCKNKSWIIFKKQYEIEHIGVGKLAYNNSRGVCVDGASYWVLWLHNETQIVYFDLRDDKFKFLQKPENVNDRPLILLLVELRGSLCMYCNVRDSKTIRIWTKEKGIDNSSWNELMIVENVDMYVWEFRPLCFVENKIIVRNNSSDSLLVYSPSEKRFEEFEGDTHVLGPIWNPIPYTESLFFPY